MTSSARTVHPRPPLQANGLRFHHADPGLTPAPVPTILIPIHNGWPDLRDCIESLLATVTDEVPIVLADDASTDPEVLRYLEAVANTQAHRVTLQRRSCNQGYLDNVNLALASIDGAVVLANSDTRFLPGWLEALRAVAAVPEVGIACPISDNATLLSIPELADLDAEAIETLTQATFGAWYELPTAVGFCMYITQEARDRVGDFDPLYAPGYGEENDYSLSLRRQGLKIAAVPASMVRHAGSSSFGPRGRTLAERHDRLLSLRWPSYRKDTMAFCQDNPLRLIRESVHSARSGARPRVLHVLHELDYLGGIELFTRELLERLPEDTEHVVLCPGPQSDPWMDLAESWLDERVRVLRFDPRRFDHPERIMGTPAGLEHPALDRLFTRVLVGGNYRAVHFHTLVRLGTLAWPQICTEHGVPYVMSVHEFFPLCHDYNLVLEGSGGRACGKVRSHEDDADCRRCLSARVGQLERPIDDYMRQRHRTWSRILAGAERIYTSGQVLSRSLAAAFGDAVEPRIEQHEPHFPDKTCDVLRPVSPPDRPLHVAILGAFSPRKGSEVFFEAVRSCSPEAARWSIIGNLNQSVSGRLDALDVRVTGAYAPDELDHWLADVDLIVLLSIWPETYSKTLSEAWARNIPVIASDIGAFRDRIEHGRTGWRIPVGEGRAVADFVSRLAGENGRRELHAVSERLRDRGRRDNDFPERLVAEYRRHTNPPSLGRLRRALHRAQAPTGLAPPHDARDDVAAWLDEPMTLEAEGDWCPVDRRAAPLLCLITPGRQADRDASRRSVEEQVPSVRFVEAADLASYAPSTPLLVLQAGARVTDNLGNWLAFQQRRPDRISSADHLLHDRHGRAYAPWFRGEGDRLFPVRQPTRWVGRLGPVGRLRETLRTPTPSIVDADPAGDAPLRHFTAPALTLADRVWAKQWARRLDRRDRADIGAGSTGAASGTSVGIVVHSGRSPSELRPFLGALFRQQHVDIAGISVVSSAPLEHGAGLRWPKLRWCRLDPDRPAHSINRAAGTLSATFLAIIGDNIDPSDPGLLHRLAADAQRFDLAGISPIFDVDRRDGRVVTLGPGFGQRGLPGRGQLTDLRFDETGTPIDCDLLDEDLMMIRFADWRRVGGFPDRGEQFYRSVLLSQALREAGGGLARHTASRLTKRALPTSALSSDPTRLRAEQEAVLHAMHRGRAGTSRSPRIGLRRSGSPEHKLHAFKAPPHRPRILAYAHDVWASGFYRVRAPVGALVGADRASCHFLPEQRERIVPTVAEIRNASPSVLLLHHFLHDEQLDRLADYQRHLDVPIVFSVDDWLLDLPGYNPFSRTIYPDMAERIRHALSFSDRLVVPSTHLAEQYRGLIDDIVVVPNRVPASMVRAPHARRVGGRLRVGWAGAPQHAGDLDWLAEVVRSTRARLDWVFFGQKPAGLSDDECEFHPPTSLNRYFDVLAGLSLDLAIAPLLDNPFNRCKSTLKLLEYSALGLPVVCSRSPAYAEAPALALDNDVQSWSEHLNALARDDARRHALAADLRHWLERSGILERHLGEWHRALWLDAAR